ncbi:NAD(P)H-hydrate dehydratase [Helicobacter suis]|uniref:NAD(P)H-hydrate dehydratase n=1 Tax=Helicobacter suis TaxID=104628 RepID=UPI0013D24FB0|nr:NAD(P)H-hydrate dehydratase [Helicobacter suis]
MQAIYKNSQELDKRACMLYQLEPELLMENAAIALKQVITKQAKKGEKVIIVCGGGDNGGDGYALARHLQGTHYCVQVFSAKEPKSALCHVQYQRALCAQVEMIANLTPCAVLVDCLFGSGLKGELDSQMQDLIKRMNAVGQWRIACDIPSGIDQNGYISSVAFNAHVSVCMGALKANLFSDMAKDFIGEVVVADLGVGRSLYETETPFNLLESCDLCLPKRTKQNVHKGYFGHACVYVGKQSGAGLISAKSALAFGAGMVSILGAASLSQSKPIELMYAKEIPTQANAFAIGMGMGVKPTFIEQMLEQGACVLDADLFYEPLLKEWLKKPYSLVLTPHPKEFLALLKTLGFKLDLPTLLRSKWELAHEFSQTFPHVVLLLKGANTLIAYNGRIFINPLGNSALAKGGSGDVLAGLVVALLAQGYTLLDAAMHASLAHALAAATYKESYALTPEKLISNLEMLACKM